MSWHTAIPEESWEAVVDALRAARDAGRPVALACHVAPDGDALGSLLAMTIVLRRSGFDVVASWGSEPFAVPGSYAFLPGIELLRPPEAFPEAPAVMLTFDAASFDRLGTLADAAKRADTLVVFDHHIAGEDFGDIRLVAPDAAATVMLVAEFLRRIGQPLDRDLAACLYTGLVTDTGRFQYSSTDAAAMELGGQLLATGIEHEELSRRIYERHPLGYLHLLSTVTGRATLDEAAGLVHAYVTQEDLRADDLEMEHAEPLVDVLRSVDRVRVALMLKEAPDGTWRVSLRSKGEVDVGSIAAAMGGGGHAYSAGFTSDRPRDEIVTEVRDRLSA